MLCLNFSIQRLADFTEEGLRWFSMKYRTIPVCEDKKIYLDKQFGFMELKIFFIKRILVVLNTKQVNAFVPECLIL